MIRKPSLFQHILGGGNHREVIGLCGVQAGTGVTYTGLLLAFYLGEELGCKTAYLECSGHHDFSRLQPAYQWSHEDEFSFSFGNISFHKDVATDKIPSLLGEEYHYVILDFGFDLSVNREEFQRCNRKLVLGGWTEWNRSRLRSFINNTDTIRGNEAWSYLIPLAGKDVIRSLKQEFHRKFYPIPLESDPLKPSKETKKLFHRLME